MAPFPWLQVGILHWRTAPILLPARPTKISNLPKLTRVTILSGLVNTAVHFDCFQLLFVQLTLFPHSSLPLSTRTPISPLSSHHSLPPRISSSLFPYSGICQNAPPLTSLFSSGFQVFPYLPFLGATCPRIPPLLTTAGETPLIITFLSRIWVQCVDLWSEKGCICLLFQNWLTQFLF